MAAREGGSDVAWQQFRGTELGGLLSKIYGNEGKPKVRYPVVRKANTFNAETAPRFLPVNNKADAVDPRKTTRREVALVVPKPTGGATRQKYAAVDMLARRRNETIIKQEVEELKEKQMHYRPAHTKAYSSDREKDRLSQIFTYKGGKALPGDIMPPLSTGLTPFEMQERKENLAKQDAVRVHRGLAARQRGLDASVPYEPPRSEHAKLQQQILDEINERTEYIEEMKAMGIKTKDENKIRAEITMRLAELEKLERAGV